MWRYFSVDEFECKCGCGKNSIDHSMINRLDNLRSELNRPLIISSGYRCAEYNNKISSTGINGPHTTGRAVDIAASGQLALDIVSNAVDFGFTGIGINQSGDNRFIHLDNLYELANRPRPWIWSY